MKNIIFKLITIVLSIMFVCSLLAGCGENKTPHNIKNIVIIIGDGMGFEHIKAGEWSEGKNYSFTDWHQTTVNTDSVGSGGSLVLTDSAAGGTAISTGTLTINGYVGKDPSLNNLTTVMDKAKDLGKATGVLSTDSIYGATPASFSGHASSRANYEEIVISQITSSNVDLLCGAYDEICVTKRDVIESNGYAYCDDYTKVESTLTADKAYWLFDIAGMSASVDLENVVSHAIAFLERDEDGFVFMIEQAHIDKYAHSNSLEGVISSVKSLNKTVETVMQWIGDRTDTAVLITADHETGGLSLGDDGEYLYQHTAKNGKVFSYSFSTGEHTRTPVGLFTYGIKPKFADFSTYSDKNLIKNIETNQIITTILKAPTAY